MGKVIHIHVHKKTTKDTLQGGKSKAAFSHNVKTEVAAGKPVKQAVAIAYSKKRETNDAPDDTSKGHWITINGAHVKVSEGGKITAGPKELKAALAHHKEQHAHHEEKALAAPNGSKARNFHMAARFHHEQAGSHLSQAAEWKSKGENTLSQLYGGQAEHHAREAGEMAKLAEGAAPEAAKEKKNLERIESEYQARQKAKQGNVKQLTKFKQPAAQKHDTAARQHAQAAAHHEAQGNEKLAHTYHALSEAHQQAARHHEAGNAEQAKKAEQLVATHQNKLKAG